MSLHFLIRNETPNGGYRYQHGISGMKFQALTLDQMYSNIRGHLKANGYPDIDIEDEICKHMGLTEPWCGEPPPPPAGQKPVIGLQDLLRGLNSIGRMVFDGGIKFVDQAEADRRAAICAGCEFNVEHAACVGCSGFSAAVEHFAGGFHAAGEEKLKACAVCKCYLAARVLVENSQASVAGLTFPAWCWQNPDHVIPDEAG